MECVDEGGREGGRERDRRKRHAFPSLVLCVVSLNSNIIKTT